MSSSSRLKRFIFTWKRPPINHKTLLLKNVDIKFIFYYKSKKSDHALLHQLKGFVELNRRRSIEKVSKWYPWCVEKHKGARENALHDVCWKGGVKVAGPWAWGKLRRESDTEVALSGGGRDNNVSQNDDEKENRMSNLNGNQGSSMYKSQSKQREKKGVKSLYGAVKMGMREREIAEAMPKEHAKYFEAARRYRSLVERDNTWEFRKIKVIVHHGPPGTGKTKAALQDKEASACYIQGAPPRKDYQYNVLWGNYEGQECLVLDDFDGWLEYTDLLRVLDGYQYQIQQHDGCLTYANWTKVIITSNKHPIEWYPHLTDISALMRRVTNVIRFK